MDLIKIENFCCAEDAVQGDEETSHRPGGICRPHAQQRALIRIILETPNNRKTNNPVKNGHNFSRRFT